MTHTHTHTHAPRLGQSQPAALEHNTDAYRARMEAFGWHAIVVDGHSIEEVCKAFHEASTVKGKPTCIVAKTFKGKWEQKLRETVATVIRSLILFSFRQGVPQC